MSPADELQSALRDLAQPALKQVVLFPDWIVVGDQLRSAFREAVAKHRAAGASLSSEQASSLEELDAYLTDLSGPYDRGFFENPAALQRDSRWQNVRDLAKAALDAFGWAS
jgi:hypothetical protein